MLGNRQSGVDNFLKHSIITTSTDERYKMFGLSYNCSTDTGFEVGMSDQGFDIAVISSTIEQMEKYVRDSASYMYEGDIEFSTTHEAVGEFILELGSGTDREIVAVVIETFIEEEGEEVTIAVGVVFKMKTTLLT
jgi:hypothetical protein